MEIQKKVVHPTLFKRGVKGEVRVWRMEFGTCPEGTLGAHRVVAGIEGGAETASGWTIGEPKNVGKKNATSSVEQAISEIDNQYAIKLERGYFRDVADVDKVQFTKPMLAQDWDKRKTKVKLADTVFIQPKLDGIRCIARADGLWTRTGKPITSCGHIFGALTPLFEVDPDLILDGELYNHDLKDDFNTIASVVRKEKVTVEEAARAGELIQFHVYDSPSEQMFTERLSRVHRLLIGLHDSIHIVPTFHATEQEALDAHYQQWMEDGYEGQMVRLNVPYEHKRSNSLMKRKDFDSAEFPVLAMEEGKGNWAGCVKRFIVQLPDGRENEAVPRGSQGMLRALLESGNKPDWVTVRYFGYTPDGKLRFPIAVDWGWGVRKD